MVQSEVGNVPVVHGATLSSDRQFHIADSLHALYGKRDSSHESGFWWYELYIHSPCGLLSVRGPFKDRHAGNPLTLPGEDWHSPNAVPLRGDVDPLPPSEMLHRKSLKLTQALPTDGANCKDMICNDPRRYRVRT